MNRHSSRILGEHSSHTHTRTHVHTHTHRLVHTHTHTHINFIAYSAVTYTGSCTHTQQAEVAGMSNTGDLCRYYRLLRLFDLVRSDCTICEDDFKGKTRTLSFFTLRTLNQTLAYVVNCAYQALCRSCYFSEATV